MSSNVHFSNTQMNRSVAHHQDCWFIVSTYLNASDHSQLLQTSKDFGFLNNPVSRFHAFRNESVLVNCVVHLIEKRQGAGCIWPKSSSVLSLRSKQRCECTDPRTAKKRLDIMRFIETCGQSAQGHMQAESVCFETYSSTPWQGPGIVLSTSEVARHIVMTHMV